MKDHYRKTHERLARESRPESVVTFYGYDPQMSQGALIPPIFLSSTFVFQNAEEGKRSFELAYQLRPPRAGEEESSLIYSRVNNPNLQILEERLTMYEKGAECAAVFSSGMAAITTMTMSLVGPGQSILFTEPVYGGTHYLFTHVLPKFGITTRAIPAGCSEAEFASGVKELETEGMPVRMIYIETPANPTLRLTSIPAAHRAAKAVSENRETTSDEDRILVAVDNTFLGPLWQQPLLHGADLVVYSATKFIGGHSDIVAGVVLGSDHLLQHHVRVYRTVFGSMEGPFAASMLTRSLDTLKLRMTAQRKNARDIAVWLKDHPRIRKVHYPGFLDPASDQGRIYAEQCIKPGSMIAFELDSQEDCYRVLDRFEIFHLAVSLGGTHSLAEHPSSMTHSDVPLEIQRRYGLTPGLIRLSIGIEHPSDLIRDLEQALAGLGEDLRP